ncbi:N5-glutamine S-adenosyl-L-methionine-dependent methyltransferase [Salinisphaera sp. PC39]|uniref:50S ribosomal protein L3 N(5)-glutamine methyltransferase n=1 Tax=Salinisphaera sp. PC39 TaxID=1304156 RepID=UPI003342A8A1
MTKTDDSDDTLRDSLLTPRDWIRWGASAFNAADLRFGHGSDNALDEAAHLTLFALHLPFDIADSYLDARLAPSERMAVLALLRRRLAERRPAPYLTGEAWFAGLPFDVDERVIIPRSPIAEMIEDGFQPWLGEREPARILDLCAGCGAIAIACAYAFPDAEVMATELDEGALAVAERNIERHEMAPRLSLRRADLFDGLDGERFDLIVTNPPYVSTEEWRGLPDEYRHEPEFAFTGGEDGLGLVARLLAAAPDHLTEDGLLVLEVGNTAFEMEARWPDLPVAWVDLERGGIGVGVIEAEDLSAWLESGGLRPARGTGT